MVEISGRCKAFSLCFLIENIIVSLDLTEGLGVLSHRWKGVAGSIDHLFLHCPVALRLTWMLPFLCLNVEVDRILEIACIITDGKLTKSVEGPDLVIHQTKECLDRMGEWCQSHHKASGLTKKVLESTVSEREAEKQVIEFVKRNVGTYTPQLAGNSVYVDFAFLKKYMPDLANLFSHVIVDVSSVKALCIRWYPRGKNSYTTWLIL
ncbi:unnamed protein product [Prunus armeniaca]|uniref:Exonuclease domain-containing protein n=1 Tax=Prunus armeniaca TaxID=36596 RepID=A0A6J5WL66_PRUAR|nr:unnamed protein product [Prunus armeniaca]